jgi:hypothetical protein
MEYPETYFNRIDKLIKQRNREINRFAGSIYNKEVKEIDKHLDWIINKLKI